MKNKIFKLLFELTENSRITTKSLSSSLRTSQQSCSYLINSLRKKRKIKDFATVVDVVRLGFTNIIAGFNFLDMDNKAKKEVIDYLKENSSVIWIEEANQGVDLIIEYSSKNLSSFNKTHSEVIDKFNKSIKTRFVLPVIVRHEYPRNYLVMVAKLKETILCGDRKYVDLSDKEKAVLNELVRSPRAKLVEISKNTKIGVKSAAAIKKSLEKKSVIKGYTAILENKKMGISRYILLLRIHPDSKAKNSLVQYAKQHKNIVEITKIIGEFQFMIAVEDIRNSEVLKDLRNNFPVENYFFIDSNSVLKKTYLPVER